MVVLTLERQISPPAGKRVSRAYLNDPANLKMAYLALQAGAIYDRDTGEMIKQPGEMPSVDHFRRGTADAVAVYNAMRRLGNGSLNRSRHELGLEERTERGGRWEDDAVFYAAMQKAKDETLYHKDTGVKIKDADILPTGQNLIDSGNSGLYHASFEFGRKGYDAVKLHLHWIEEEDTSTNIRELPGQKTETADGYLTRQQIENAVIAIAEKECTTYTIDGRAVKVGPTIERIGEIDPELKNAISGLREIYRNHGFVPVEATERVLAGHGFFDPLIKQITETEYMYQDRIVKKKGEMPTRPALEFLTDAGLLTDIHYNGLILDGRKLAHIIGAHLGGFTKVASDIGKRPKKRRNGYWTETTLIKEAVDYLAANGSIDADGRYTLTAAESLMPKALQAAGRGDLNDAIMDLGREKILASLDILRIPTVRENEMPPPVYADDIVSAVYPILSDPLAPVLIAFCFDIGLGTEQQLREAYKNISGHELTGKSFRNAIRVLIDNWAVKKIQLGNETVYTLRPFGEYYAQPVAFKYLAYVADTAVPISVLMGKRHKEPLVVMRTAQKLSGLPQVFDTRLEEGDMRIGIRQLKRLHQLHPDGPSGEIVYLAEMLLVPLEAATRDLNELPELREPFDRKAANDTTYAKAYAEAFLKVA